MFNNRYNILVSKKHLLSIDYLFLCDTISVLKPQEPQLFHSLYELQNQEGFKCNGDFLLSALYFLFFFGIPDYECGTDTNQSSHIHSFQDFPTNFKPVHSCDNFYSSSRNICAYSTITLGTVKGTPIRFFISFLPYNFSNIRAIQHDIMTNGPVATTFNAYSDFWTYDTSKIYHKSPDAVFVSGHAILLIGWKDDYWIFQNSWGDDWGNHGVGYFEMGTDHCNIETNALAVRSTLYEKDSMLHNWQDLLLEFDINRPKINEITRLYFDLTRNSGIYSSPKFQHIDNQTLMCGYAPCANGSDPIQINGYSFIYRPLFPGVNLNTSSIQIRDHYILHRIIIILLVLVASAAAIAFLWPWSRQQPRSR
jgi:hypothetical protein